MALGMLGLALVLPFIAFALNAFSRQWFYPQLVPKTWSLEAWQRIFSSRSRVPEALFNSAVIAAGVTLASVVIGLPTARALGMAQFRGKRIVELLIFAPTMVPPLAVGIGTTFGEEPVLMTVCSARTTWSPILISLLLMNSAPEWWMNTSMPASRKTFGCSCS